MQEWPYREKAIIPLVDEEKYQPYYPTSQRV